MTDKQFENAAMAGMQRRRVLTGVAAGGIGAAMVAAAGIAAPAHAQQAAPSDEDILNFALNFEYLGAELYLRALTGVGLQDADTAGVGTKGTVVAGGPVPLFTAGIKDVVRKLAADEVAHVRTLRARLGDLAVAEPGINLTTSWTTIAIAAGVIGPDEVFDPFADEISLLKAAYILEDVCVTALAGALPLFTQSSDVAAAAGFLGTEAAQASAIRMLLSFAGQGHFTDAISALRARLSNAADDIGTLIQGNHFNFVSNDDHGAVFARTPAQVLNIAYGGGAASGYGFFPDRVNGVIN